jgi:hypothetical protein
MNMYKLFGWIINRIRKQVTQLILIRKCKCKCCFVVSPCVSLTCQNEGSCRVNNGIASCFCKGDYTGVNCEGKVELIGWLINWMIIT